MLTITDANEQVTRLTALLKEVVVAREASDADNMKFATYEVATVPKGWFGRVDSATTYVAGHHTYHGATLVPDDSLDSGHWYFFGNKETT